MASEEHLTDQELVLVLRDLVIRMRDVYYGVPPELDEVRTDIPVEDQINRARRCVLVHSIAYYVYDENLISDFHYDQWGKRLMWLQFYFPKSSANTPFMLDIFQNFSGTTSGYDLPLKDPWGDRTTRWLLTQHDRKQQTND